jgi:hypothetical protein
MLLHPVQNAITLVKKNLKTPKYAKVVKNSGHGKKPNALTTEIDRNEPP